MKRKLIIDTDPGHDDALAIMLAVKSGLFDILALTTVPGNSNIKNVTRNATYILGLLDSDIPIYSGNNKPLKRKLVQAVVHGTSGLDGVDMTGTKFKETRDAHKQIIKLVKKYPGEITLLTLGPLTNIARAIQEYPSLPKKVKQIVMMAGAIDVAGNKNRVAEFNMFVDPEAADVVFRAQVSKVIIPIDVCNDMPLFLSDFERLKGVSFYEPLMGMMGKFIEGIEKFEGTKGALVYDAVAAYYLIDPKAFKVEQMDVVIETKGEHTFGMTVAEKRISEKKNLNVGVVRSVNRDQFREDFIKTLKK